MGRTLSEKELERRMTEKLWLEYFNRFLFREGTISKREYERMTEKILAYTERQGVQTSLEP